MPFSRYPKEIEKPAGTGQEKEQGQGENNGAGAEAAVQGSARGPGGQAEHQGQKTHFRGKNPAPKARIDNTVQKRGRKDPRDGTADMAKKDK